MSLALASKLLFENEAGGFSIFSVQTLRCAYRAVTYHNDYVKLYGPGVDGVEIDTSGDALYNLPSEAQALIAVVMFEEGD